MPGSWISGPRFLGLVGPFFVPENQKPQHRQKALSAPPAYPAGALYIFHIFPPLYLQDGSPAPASERNRGIKASPSYGASPAFPASQPERRVGWCCCRLSVRNNDNDPRGRQETLGEQRPDGANAVGLVSISTVFKEDQKKMTATGSR